MKILKWLLQACRHFKPQAAYFNLQLAILWGSANLQQNSMKEREDGNSTNPNLGGCLCGTRRGGISMQISHFLPRIRKRRNNVKLRSTDWFGLEKGWLECSLTVCVGLSRRVARLFLVGLSLAGVEPVSSWHGMAVGFDLYSFGVMFCFMGMLPLFPLI